MLVVTELFNMAVNDFDAKQSARYSRVLAVTELVLSGTQGISLKFQSKHMTCEHNLPSADTYCPITDAPPAAFS